MADQPPAPARSRAAQAARLGAIVLGLALAGYVYSRLATLGDVEPLGPGVPAEEVVHLHGIGLNPQDGQVYLAAHTGLLMVTRSGQVTRIADRYQDTMGFTVVGPDEFLGSGHPDLREDLPSRLGLIRSNDAGMTWTSVSLSDEADLHAIVVTDGGIYAADSTTQRLLRSDDAGATWTVVAEVDLGAVAVSPDGRVLVGTTSTGDPVRSDDGGTSWTAMDGPLLTALVWDAEVGPVATGVDGTVLRPTDDGRSWSVIGDLDGENPVIASVDGGELIAATDGAVVSHSRDGGRTWISMP